MFDHLVRNIGLFLLCIFCLAPTTNAQNAVAPTNLNYPNPTSAVDQKDDFQKNVVDHKGTTRRRLTCTASTITECCDTAAISGLCTGNTGGVGDVDCSKEATNNFNKGSKVQGSTASECCEPVPGVQASNNVLLTSSNCASLGGEMRSPQTKLECESVSRQLGLSFFDEESPGTPAGCYQRYSRTYFNPDTSSTTPCSSSKKCICFLLCQPGTFQDEPNKITCKSCPQNEYSSAGRSKCEYDSKSCPKGTYADDDKKDDDKKDDDKEDDDKKKDDKEDDDKDDKEDDDKEDDEKEDSGTSACTSCGPGKYNDLVGQTSEASCKQCSFDTYFDKGESGLEDCKSCPLNEKPTIDQQQCIPVKVGPPLTLCRRDKTTICRGSATKFVEAASSWVIPPLKQSRHGKGIMISGFGDIDDDGDIDMVSAVQMFYVDTYNNENTVHLILYENTAGNKTGTPPIWVEKETIATNFDFILDTDAGTHVSLFLVDLNYDNKLDIVFSNSRSPVVYYKNIGETNRAEWIRVDEVTTESPFAEMIQFTNNVSKTIVPYDRKFAYPLVVYADMDGDGDLDIIRAGMADGVYYIENIAADKEAPVYQQKGEMLMAATIVEKSTVMPGIALGDLDNDGDLDLLIGGSDNVHVLENTGSRKQPAFTQRDLAWMGFDTSGFLPGNNGHGAGLVRSASRPDFCGNVLVQQMIDIDLDGLLEFVYVTNVKMKFFRQATEVGAFAKKAQWDLKDELFGSNASPISVDLNGDGHEDLVVGGAENVAGFVYYLFEKIGVNAVEFSEKKSLKDKDGNAIVGTNPIFIDVDLDGLPDLLTRKTTSSYTQDFVYYKNTASTTSDPFQFEKQSLISSNFKDNNEEQSSWQLFSDCTICTISTGHFDNDNILDLMLQKEEDYRYPNANIHFLYKHNSDGTFSHQAEWDNNNGLPEIDDNKQITFGDVDQDGDDDAVLGTNFDGLEYYERIQLVPPKWIQRDGSDGWALEVNTLGAYVKPTLIDYDIDGDVDLIVANGAGNIFLFVQGGCAGDCTTSGSCNVGTEQMPTCSCSFAGATDGRSCNSW
jgi:hypothetical protein